MASNPPIPKLERVTYVNGQRLNASDLTDAQEALRELRWLHNRSLHGWGIVFGLAVSGKKGDSQVSVATGFALDSLGREIILDEPRTVIVPPVTGDNSGKPLAYLLTIACPADDELSVTERRDGVCTPGGAVRLIDVPRLRWLQFPGAGYDIILAQAWVQNCRLARPLSFTQRRSARPAQQPYIATGQTDPKSTIWTPIQSNSIIGFSTEVDTSSAHFQTTPVYQARIAGLRVLTQAQGIKAVFDGLTNIREPTPTRFVLDVLMPQGNLQGGIELNPANSLQQDKPKQLGWHVVWMGVEGSGDG